MKKRILSLLLCLLVVFTSAPAMPVSDLFKIEAVAVSVENLEEALLKVPPEEDWSDYIDTSVMEGFYNMAKMILQNPSGFSQEYIDSCAENLTKAINDLKVHTTSIRLNQTAAIAFVGQVIELRAILNDGAANVGDSVTWSSTEPSYVSVNNIGQVSVNRYISTPVEIRATSNGHSATCTVTVHNPVAGVTLSRNDLELYLGQSFKLAYTLIGLDSSADPTGDVDLIWDSDNVDVVDVSEDGLLTATGVGEATVTLLADIGYGSPFTAQCKVTVKDIVFVGGFQPVTVVTNGKLILTEGQQLDFSVIVLPTNASIKDLKWSSGASDVVSVSSPSVSQSGVAKATLTANKEGTAQITYAATDGSGKSGSFTVEVRPKITSLKFSSTAKSITLTSEGEKLTPIILPSNAGNQVLTWTSSDKNICEVDYNGVLYPVSEGDCIIRAATTDGSGLVAECKIIVGDVASTVSLNKSTLTLENGSSQTLYATVTTISGSSYGDVTWSSNNTDVAVVDSEGKVTAKYPGTAAIKATAVDGTGKSAVCIVTVTQKITAITMPEKKTLAQGESISLNPVFEPSYATEKDLIWSSSANTVASVDADGVVTGKSVGTAIITCRSGNVSASCTVNVVIKATGINLSLTSDEMWKGEALQLVAYVTPDSATDKSVKWESTNTDVATVTQDGLVIAVAGGTCIIKATNSSGITASCRLTVYEDATGILLTPTTKSMYVGQYDTLTATVLPETASNREVTWQSSQPNVVYVDQYGSLQALKTGSAVITATTVNGGYSAKCTVTVYGKIDVTGLSLNRSSITVKVDEIAQLLATISPANASEKGVQWKSSDTRVFICDQKGRIKGVSAGKAILSATSVDNPNCKFDCLVEVVQPVTGIRITTTEVKIAVGKSRALQYNIFPENATNQEVKWKSSNTDVADVSSSGVVTAKKAGITSISVTTVDGEFTSTCNFTVYVPVTGVEMSVDSIMIPKGETRLMQAIVSPSNATNKAVTWASSNTAVATINEAGQITAKAKGTAKITATTADGAYKATCTVEVLQLVTAVSLDIASISLEVGKQKTLTAKVTPSTASYPSVKWKSSNTNVVTVTSSGVIKGVSAGSAVITATSVDGNASAQCKVEIIQPVTGISLNRTTGFVRIGQLGVLKATVTPANATNQRVTWTSSDKTKATVDSDGVVTGISAGYVDITATTVSGGFKATCRVRVIKSVTGVKVDKAILSLNVGKSTTITPICEPADASVKTVTWTSSNYDVATVDSTGKVTAKSAGYAVITCKTTDGNFTAKSEVTVIQPVTGVTLNKTFSYLNLNATMTLVPTIAPSNASIKSVTWTSSDPKVASVNSSGVVTGIKTGMVTITCKTTNGGYTAACTVAVVRRVTGISLDKSEAILYLGKALTLKSTVYPSDASVKTVTYSSLDEKVAKVSSTGVVSPVSIGEVYIVATTKDGNHKAYCKVYVKKAPESIKLGAYTYTMYTGKTATLKYAVYPADATNRTATFTSSNPDVATINSKGLITAISRGTTVLTATTENGIKAQCTLTVKQSVTGVEITPVVTEVYTGKTVTLNAKVLPEDANVQTVTWSSSDKTVATVSSKGVVTGLKAGTAIISAVSTDGSYKAESTVTVKQYASSVSFEQSELYINKGSSYELKATVLPFDTTDKSLTFESSAPDIVSVNSEGKITAHLGGQAVITAKVNVTDGREIVARCYVNVVEPVTGVSLNINEKTIFVGESLTLVATVSPSDAYNKAIRWSSSDGAVAEVSSQGVVTALKSGTATIYATSVDGNITAECKLTLLQRATEVSVSETNIKFNRGTTYQLTAEILPEDCYNKAYTWKSENEEIATVDETGLVTGVAPGVTKLICTSDESGVSTEVTVTVHEPATSLSLNESEILLYTPFTYQLEATIGPENASDKTVIWSSSDEEVVSVDENGLVTALKAGEATVTAVSADNSELEASCDFEVRTGVEQIITEKDEYSFHEDTDFTIPYTLNPTEPYNSEVTFESSNETVFTVDGNGKLHGVCLGVADLTITSVQNPLAVKVVKINVTRAVVSISLDFTEKTVFAEESFTLIPTVLPEDASDRSVKFQSSDESVATVDENGVVYAVGGGEAVITATTTDGEKTATCNLTVIRNAQQVVIPEDSYTVNNGDELTLEVTVLPEDTSDKTVIFISSDEEVASVDENGKVTPHKAGTCEITAKSTIEGVEKTVTVTVIQLCEEIAFYCRIPDLWIGEKVRAIATILPYDTTDKSFSWSSSDESVATVDKYGVIRAVSGGKVQIIATSHDEGGVKGIINLRVMEEISGIDFLEGERTVETGKTISLEAKVFPEAAYDTSVIYKSENEEVATVNEDGTVTGVKGGTAKITAATVDGKFIAECFVTVIVPTEGIKLYRTDFDLKVGERAKVQYDVMPEDATDKSVQWSSDNEEICTVSNEGVITALKEGEAKLRIETLDGRFFGECTVKVIAEAIEE
ncbi:MAG: Ig domain-containing protein [Acutalibacteraceae bacterium]